MIPIGTCWKRAERKRIPTTGDYIRIIGQKEGNKGTQPGKKGTESGQMECEFGRTARIRNGSYGISPG